MNNSIQIKNPWFLIAVLFLILEGCSYGVDILVRIIPPDNMTPIEAFNKLNEMVGTWPELTLDSKCEDNTMHYMYKYRLTSDSSIYAAAILNANNGTLAFGYGQLGVKEFTAEAENTLRKLSSRLMEQFGAERVIVIENSKDHRDLERLLKGDERRLYYCG